MAEKFVLMTDDACDLPEEYYVKSNIPLVHLSFTIDDKNYNQPRGRRFNSTDIERETDMRKIAFLIIYQRNDGKASFRGHGCAVYRIWLRTQRHGAERRNCRRRNETEVPRTKGNMCGHPLRLYGRRSAASFGEPDEAKGSRYRRVRRMGRKEQTEGRALCRGGRPHAPASRRTSFQGFCDRGRPHRDKTSYIRGQQRFR